MFYYLILLNLLVIIISKTSDFQIKKFAWLKQAMSNDKVKNYYKKSFKPVKKFFYKKIKKVKYDLIDMNIHYYNINETDRYLFENIFCLLFY